MKKLMLSAILVLLAALVAVPAQADNLKFTWGMQRDLSWWDRCFPPPIYFPPVCHPCAVPCRPPGGQIQSVPKPIETACPSRKLPCYGVAYETKPYSLFR